MEIMEGAEEKRNTEYSVCACMIVSHDTHLVPVMEDGAHDGDEVCLGREVLHPQHPLELLHNDDRRRAAHEPGDRRPRQEIHYQP